MKRNDDALIMRLNREEALTLAASANILLNRKRPTPRDIVVLDKAVAILEQHLGEPTP